jgi:hypothetical protein
MVERRVGMKSFDQIGGRFDKERGEWCIGAKIH